MICHRILLRRSLLAILSTADSIVNLNDSTSNFYGNAFLQINDCISKKRPIYPSRFFLHRTLCAVRLIHTRAVVFPRLGQTARGRDEKSDDYAEQRIQIALVSRLVSSSCSCLAKFLRSPPSSSIL